MASEGMTQIQVESDAPAQMRDGTVPRADAYRPGDAGPWPVLLARSPYGKQTPVAGIAIDPLAAAGRGFMVVTQDTRGRFASEGEWEPWTHEESDGHDTVRWVAALPGSERCRRLVRRQPRRQHPVKGGAVESAGAPARRRASDP